jgi:hypothetical protein
VTFAGAPLSVIGPAAAVGVAALVTLYLLRERRRRVEVPFAGLWQRVLKETKSTAWWRQLRRLVSLLIQLLVLALLLIALRDPRLGASQSGRSIAIVVDTSASMQARDGEGGGTRLDQAKRAAERLVRGLGPLDEAMVLSMDARPAAQTGLSGDERELLSAIGKLEATDTVADVDRGVRLAADALRGRSQPTLVLITDGAGVEEDRLARLDLDVRHIAVGPNGPADNLAVTAFAARRYRANQTAYEVLAEVRSFATVPVPCSLTLLQDGQPVETQHFVLAAGERVQRIYPNLAGEGSRLEARLERDGGGVLDVLPLDDRAYAVLPPRRNLRVLVVTAGNLFLEGALMLNENLELKKTASWDPAAATGFDAVIFDGITPETPPAVDAIYIDPHGPTSPFPSRGEIANPIVTEVVHNHPLTRWLTLADLNISRASRFVLQPGDVAVASALKQPIIVGRDHGGRKALAIGFDVKKSDLPLRVAFPVLLVNALEWFTGADNALLQTFPTGETWRLGAPAGAREVEVRFNGAPVRAPVADGRANYTGMRVGFYELRTVDSRGALGAPVIVAASLGQGRGPESRITPKRTLTVAGKQLQPPDAGRVGVRRALWPYLAVLALLILLVEWWTYNRRVTV